MAYSIGKIRKYKDYVGEIVAKDGIYIFTSNNTTNLNFEEGDMVIFRAEQKENVKVAYFVKKISISNKIKKGNKL